MADVLELFSNDNVVSYVNNRERQQHLGELLFPSRKINGLEFDMLRAGSRIPEIAGVKAFDTESPIQSRQGSKSAAELALISSKIALKEKDLIALRNPRNAEEQRYLTQEVFNDTFSQVEAVRAQVEKMRMDVLANGQLELVGNGLNTVVDYHVPSEHKASRQIGESTALTEVLSGWADELDVAPTRILTSKKVRNKILANGEIQELFKTSGMLPTAGNLNNLFETLGLPTIVTYDEKYRTRDGSRKRYFPENKLVMFSEATLGETVFGSTPEESRLISAGTLNTRVNDILAMVYEEKVDPVATWTKAVATALPSFIEADNVFQATITGL